MLRKWELPAWDVLLVGDGSGAEWHRPMGWAVVVVDRTEQEKPRRALLYGGCSHGSVMAAELLPYLQALSFHSAHKKRAGHADRIDRVLIVTDNSTVADLGQKLVNRERSLSAISAHQPLWNGLMAFERMGYRLSFAWKARSSMALNCLCDHMARQLFRAMQGVYRPAGIDGEPLSPYDVNPDTDTPSRVIPHDALPKRRAN